MSRSAAWGLFVLVATIVFAVEQLVKQVVISSMARGDESEIIFGLKLVNTRNDGVAFGMFAGSDLIVLGFTVLAMVALVVYFASNPIRPGLWLAAGLLAGGAIGNLVDRLRLGAVVDFLDFLAWPAFNLADVAIVAGAVGLAFILMQGPKPDA